MHENPQRPIAAQNVNEVVEIDEDEIDTLFESAHDDQQPTRDELKRVNQSTKFSNPHRDASRNLLPRAKKVGIKVIF